MAELPLMPSTPFTAQPLQRVAVLQHPRVPASYRLMQDIRKLLERCGVQSFAGSVWETQALEEMLPGIDVCITLGGDGSMLRVARVAAPFAVPVLGINLGKLGFLAELDPNQVENHLPGILSGNYWIEERMMIAADLHSQGSVAGRFDCLNEVVVARRHLSRVVRIEARLDGYHLTTYTGDGVLVATPTGSTAYSLAAGGPVLHPEVRNLVLTPISAFLSLRSPLVLPETTEIQLTVSTDHEAGASFDGQSDVELQSGDIVVIRVGPNPARFLRVQERAYFYHTLVHKLGINH